MKKIVAGGFLLFSGVFLYIGIQVSVALYSIAQSNAHIGLQNYDYTIGVISGKIGVIIAILLGILGTVIILWELSKDRISKIWHYNLEDEEVDSVSATSNMNKD